MVRRNWVARRAFRWCRALPVGLAVAFTTATPALAAPEEIQVYMDELDDPGDIGLDVHTSYVASGDRTADYRGEQQSVDRVRITPEFSLGLTKTLELGLYLPLATIDHSGQARVDGVKFRLKYIAPHRESGWFYGANFEIGRVGHRLDENPYNAELKGIVGRRSEKWTVAVNANFDFKVDGPVPAPASLEIATRISRAISKSVAIGIESYNGVGEFRRLAVFGGSDQSTFVVIDTKVGRWDLNLGVGHGYGAAKDGLIVKAIIGVPIGRSPRRNVDTPG